MRRSTVVLVVALVAACARQNPHGPGSGGDPTGPDSNRVEIYTAAFRALAETESWFDPVLLDEHICPDVADVVGVEPAPCEERFTDAEEAAILAGLPDLPHVRFVDDAERIEDRIFAGELQGAGLLTVGPTEGDALGVTVGGRSYCGNVCAHWMTLVIEEGDGGWAVTGTTGPIAIS